MSGIHYIDFHGDARAAICGWAPPGDYAGTTVYLSSATCRQCIAAIQARISALATAAPCASAGSPPPSR